MRSPSPSKSLSLRVERTAFLGAGHETTATGMTWTLWLLACNMDKQKKLRDEVADLLGRKMEPTMDDLNSLPYLEGVVKYALSPYLAIP